MDTLIVLFARLTQTNLWVVKRCVTLHIILFLLGILSCTPDSNPALEAQPTQNPDNTTCMDITHNDAINWRDTSLTDTEVIECLATSLGQPIGFGEHATGGNVDTTRTKLIVITHKNPEKQLLEALQNPYPKWIVFDKNDFKDETYIMMYRNQCHLSALKNHLNTSEKTCKAPFDWCLNNNISQDNCLRYFFNNALNHSALPIDNIAITSNTTLDGRGSQATIFFNGFEIGKEQHNVIITHTKFKGTGNIEDHALDPDMIRITDQAHTIWIHKNTFETTGDSAFDVKKGAYDITVSYNRLNNVKRASLHGASDDERINEKIRTTMHHNLFFTSDHFYNSTEFNSTRRVPLLRRGQSHLFNNVFYNYRKNILSVRAGGQLLLENSLFIINEDAAELAGDHISDYPYYFFKDYRDGGLQVQNTYVGLVNNQFELLEPVELLRVNLGNTPNLNALYQYPFDQKDLGEFNMESYQHFIEQIFVNAGKE